MSSFVNKRCGSRKTCCSGPARRWNKSPKPFAAFKSMPPTWREREQGPRGISPTMSNKHCWSCILGLSLLVTPGYAASRTLTARTYSSGFSEAHDTYNAMGAASDGKIYYVISSESIDVGAQMYSFDPKARKIQHLGDLTEACGEKGLRAIPQGKSHVNFVEANGKLYFASHVGVYTIIDG